LLLAGAILGATGVVAVPPPAWLPGAALLLSLAAWFSQRTRLTVAALGCGFLAAALILAVRSRDQALHPSLRAVLDGEFGGFDIGTLGPEGEHDAVPLRLRLSEDAANQGDYVSLRGQAKEVRLNGAWRQVEGGVLLTVAGNPRDETTARWRAGRVVEMPVVFHRPARYLDEGVSDFEQDLALSGTTLFGSIKSGLLIEVLRPGSRVEEWTADVRAHVRNAIARWVAEGRGATGRVTAAVIVAVLVGDRTGLPDEVRDRLQAAGTYHVIAISGGNIAIVAMLVIGLLAIAGVQGRMAALLAIATLLGYAEVVTAGPSVWRATMMAIVYLSARVLDHRTPAWQAMAVAAALLVATHPLDVRNAGFLLTFGAAAALLECARWATGRPRSRVAAWLVGSLAASAAVEVVLMPVSAESFSRITSAGLILNLVAVPVMAVVQIAGTVIVLLTGWPLVAGPAGWLAHSGAWLLLESARLVDVAPWLARRVPPPGILAVSAYYAGLAALAFGRRQLRAAGGLLFGLALAAIVYGVTPAPPGGDDGATLRLTVFDVGQGDAMLLQSAAAAPMLIDSGGEPFGGGSFDIGARVLTPALWARGVRSLGTLLVTHGDPDHIGGAGAVLDEFSPARLWLGITVPTHLPEQMLLRQARDRDVDIETRRSGQQVTIGPATIRVLHPPEPDWERRRVRNDDSVVLEIVYRDVALLLTGDIGDEVERAILPQLTPAPVRILKVAHHGSRTSSSRALLDGWRPQIAIISCGRGNPFGHPAAEVVQRLESIGATIYRTDRDGEVTLDTDGRHVHVRTFVGGAR
jgi:competence protein ComEC